MRFACSVRIGCLSCTGGMLIFFPRLEPGDALVIRISLVTRIFNYLCNMDLSTTIKSNYSASVLHTM